METSWYFFPNRKKVVLWPEGLDRLQKDFPVQFTPNWIIGVPPHDLRQSQPQVSGVEFSMWWGSLTLSSQIPPARIPFPWCPLCLPRHLSTLFPNPLWSSRMQKAAADISLYVYPFNDEWMVAIVNVFSGHNLNSQKLGNPHLQFCDVLWCSSQSLWHKWYHGRLHPNLWNKQKMKFTLLPFFYWCRGCCSFERIELFKDSIHQYRCHQPNSRFLIPT